MVGRYYSPSLTSCFRNEPNKIHLLFDSKESGKNILLLSFSAETNSQDLDLVGHYQTLIFFTQMLIQSDSIDLNRLRANASKGLQHLKLYSLIPIF